MFEPASPVQFPVVARISLLAASVIAPLPPEKVISPVTVSAALLRMKALLCKPSKVSASKPEPDPSLPACQTVLPAAENDPARTVELPLAL